MPDASILIFTSMAIADLEYPPHACLQQPQLIVSSSRHGPSVKRRTRAEQHLTFRLRSQGLNSRQMKPEVSTAF
ncbi:uncharacterized protein LAJ45_01414 [Morchella importuna]|uniref:uncharacterized protein n=1 Tax=Morchella importuna TaxID=1174673 RepID=UPI001E8DA376|nr:uncharacterized protein LAJ45_01414 [Morchella importuna]KAH8154883.1 hypothetical protein LAJ45_01414 [Morchella importuna]